MMQKIVTLNAMNPFSLDDIRILSSLPNDSVYTFCERAIFSNSNRSVTAAMFLVFKHGTKTDMRLIIDAALYCGGVLSCNFVAFLRPHLPTSPNKLFTKVM